MFATMHRRAEYTHSEMAALSRSQSVKIGPM